MKILLNGQPHQFEGEATVAALLAILGLDRKPVVVELDGEALTQADHPRAALTEGARVEVIVLAAGG